MDCSGGLRALRAEIDKEQQELLATLEEQHRAWELQLRVAFARLRTLSRQHSGEADNGESADVSLPAEKGNLGPSCFSLTLQGHRTAQPLASEVDPLPARADEHLEIRVQQSPTCTGDRSLSPQSTAGALLPPSAAQNGKVTAPAMSQLDFRMTDKTAASGVALLRKRVGDYIDYVAGVLVLLNTLLMLAELELEGRAAGHRIGLSEDIAFETMEPTFRVFDSMFVYVYLIELLLRIWITWPDFHRSFANWFDCLLVASGLASQLPNLNPSQGLRYAKPRRS